MAADAFVRRRRATLRCMAADITAGTAEATLLARTGRAMAPRMTVDR